MFDPKLPDPPIPLGIGADEDKGGGGAVESGK